MGVGGGGGGATDWVIAGNNNGIYNPPGGGGGGGGAFIANLVPGGYYTFSVGAGGAGAIIYSNNDPVTNFPNEQTPATAGGNSTMQYSMTNGGSIVNTITAYGGGGGGQASGATGSPTPGPAGAGGTAGQSNSSDLDSNAIFYTGAAGATGQSLGNVNGNVGSGFSIPAANISFAGGNAGIGWEYIDSSGGSGGGAGANGVGGNGGSINSNLIITAPTAGATNSGAGGGSGPLISIGQGGAAGGSGIFILKYYTLTNFF